jgi:peptide/nickel transport system permease protein
MRRIVTALATVFNAMPTFLSGLLLIVLFATTLRALPSIGWVSMSDGGLGQNLQAMVLPSIALGLSIFPDYMRVFHAEITEQLEREEYVTLARMKGLPGTRVMLVHVVRNAAGGMITLVGITTGFLLAGVVVVEQIFSIPGLGSLTLRAVNDRDSPMLQGAIVVIAVGVVVINLIADLIQMKIDPRLRPTSGKRRQRIRGGVTSVNAGADNAGPTVPLLQEGARR